MNNQDIRQIQAKQLKEHVLEQLKRNPNYLQEQIQILDSELALFKACGLVIENEEIKTLALDLLIELQQDLKND